MATLSRSGSRGGTLVPAGRAVGLFLLLLFLFSRFRDAFGLPFLNDDYVFLDHVSRRGFGALWGFHELAFHWWRPWSREFHYWWLQHAFGPSEWPFHLASFVLAGGVLASYWALTRRLAGAAAAAIAVAGAATLPGWGLLLLWSAGAQDLWMLLLSLLALIAWHEGRIGWAAAGYALALASKETAAPLPLLFLAHDALVGRRPWPESLLRGAPALAVGAAWTLAHPLLLGRWWAGAPTPLPPSPAAVPPWLAVGKAALSVFSLDVWPAPEGGWGAVWWDAARAAFLLVVFVELLARPDLKPTGIIGARAVRPRGAGGLGLAWWAVGSLPLLLPGLGWHAYYAQFASLGAWLAIGRLLARHGGIAMGLVGLLAVLGAGRAATPSQDWGEAAYQRRAGAYVDRIRDFLRVTHPTFPPHTRLWFVRLPNNVGFLAGDGPAVRVWYRDSTLRAGYYSAYTARAPGEPDGADHFFRMDEAGQLREVRRDAADDTARAVVAQADTAATQDDPRWQTDRLALANAFAKGGNWRGAASEYRRLALAFPDSGGYAFDAASAYLQSGDTNTAYAWLREAARRPGASPELLRAVKSLLPEEKPARRKRPRSAKERARENAGLRRR
jgi:hypothetical protein